MSINNIVNELKELTNVERIIVIEAATKLIRNDIESGDSVDTYTQHQRLEAAANALLSDYQTDKELTAFTTLDNEDFLNA